MIFERPVKEKKIRNGLTAYQYRNGTINIGGAKYVMYSMSEAIALHRKKYPFKHNSKNNLNDSIPNT